MVVIGRYSKKDGDGLPKITELISDTEVNHKKEILAYLKNADVYAAIPGVMVDAITGEKTDLEYLLQTDGDYLWHSDVPYLVEKYNMKLPQSFVDHILKQ